jgi:hypothetical protein
MSIETRAQSDAPYERPMIVVMQPDAGEMTPTLLPIVVFAVVLAVDVATWGVAVHTLHKATKSSARVGWGEDQDGPTFVALAGLRETSDQSGHFHEQ